jgi:hypothetical protein
MDSIVKETLKNAFSDIIATNVIFNQKLNKTLPDNIRNFYKNKINPNNVHDKNLIKEEYYDIVNWSILERNKALRTLSRNIDLLEYIDIKKYNFSISELFPLFLRYPQLIEDLVGDFNNLKISECIQLLECNPKLINSINIFKFELSSKDLETIVKKFRKNSEILDRFDLTKLDHYATRQLLSKTGIDYVDRVNLNKLKDVDWLAILEMQPELIDYCDLQIFQKNDCYLLTKIVIMFPELSYLIQENKDKISSLGWENLIVNNLEEFQDLCVWEKLEKNNWNNIIKIHPELEYKKQEFFIF